MNSLANQNNKSSNSQLKPLNSYELTEKDFYPPEDTRVFRSGVENIIGGDNFEDYAKDFYDDYEDELFDN